LKAVAQKNKTKKEEPKKYEPKKRFIEEESEEEKEQVIEFKTLNQIYPDGQFLD